MMGQALDFFALTGLPYDPPLYKKRQVENAINEAIAHLRVPLGFETRVTNRDRIRSQLDFLLQQSEFITKTEWDEASKHFAKMADEKRSRECEKIHFTALLMIQAGIHSAYRGTLRSFSKKTGLSTETIQNVFSKCGFTIITQVWNTPQFSESFEDIMMDLAALREIKNPNPNGPDPSAVTDIYCFAAFIMDDLGHANLYKKLTTAQLKTVIDLAAQKYSNHVDVLGKLCSLIAMTASRVIFESDETRKQYDKFLVYHSEDIQKLFYSLSLLPSGILLNPAFAEKCISNIKAYVSDYDTALSIYNQEGHLFEVPYPPYPDSGAALTVQSLRYRRRTKKYTPTLSPTSKIYGIDLGTTYSAIATLDDNGNLQIIANVDDDSKLLASAVYFPEEGGDPVVGEAAKNMKDSEPERVVEFIKRFIGKEDAPTYEFNGIKYDPINISNLILRRIKEYADKQGHNVQNVVITCPAYFGQVEKAATLQAGKIAGPGKIAGLKVIDIVPEPVAAVMYYCGREFKEDRRIMVYDLGGGTFDITLFDFAVDENGKATIDVIKTGGDDRLGGIDWDARLFDCMCKKYAEENAIEVAEMDSEIKAIIRAQVEQAKKDLSALQQKKYTIRYDGDSTSIVMTRQEFEEITQDLVQRTLDFVQKLLQDVNMTPDDVDLVLLVGGSTLMPMIQNAVGDIFPGKVRIEEPDLVVAEGAALCAAVERFGFEHPTDHSDIEFRD